ncbi:hypothetical protein Kpol_1061p6 [Vanderwaltozyma polyspora DSM 70294]|uniref:Uncharacterized protein n=1 Tax=Vanderwaltozyma polyspora (strain ATCC 22028 / DSM 70294 / BCRC 21397 / CBS 2163 / NBRC 10782 / NRRL Y-8283 / UCD 57-17) TaxID=436907 RepID=A7TJD4_VANPO|nr:uncharacterized protein Kpol_1061p6 [Vanderwaltozyma polyspora DSM 70294]EDO17584.1 hypothetical protein Kpol_1061p6 [Vanderwaltozyma polyspora DSM 70294]
MNYTLLQYKLGRINNSELVNLTRLRELERIVESSTPKIYNYHKKSELYGAITCLDIDNGGEFYLGATNNGSISLWGFNERLEVNYDSNGSKIYDLVNKRLNYAKRSTDEEIDISNAQLDSRKRARQDEADMKLVHSFETSRNKYRMYRKSNNTHSVQRKEEPSQEEDSLESHKYSIRTLKWYKDDNGMFFTGSYDNSVKIWNTNEFVPVQDIKLEHKVNQIDCSYQGTNMLVVATDDYHPRLIDLNNMNLGLTSLGNANNSEMKSPILCCKFNPQRTNIVATGDENGQVKLWDLRKSNRQLLELKDTISGNAHLRGCNDIEWDETGREIVTVGLDGKIKKWTPFSDLNSMISLQLGDTDIMRNRYTYRTSQRLIWYGDYILLNTDNNEITIFETIEGKQWNKIKNPQEQFKKITKKDKSAQINAFSIQRNPTNSNGTRLLLATSNCILEYP